MKKEWILLFLSFFVIGAATPDYPKAIQETKSKMLTAYSNHTKKIPSRKNGILMKAATLNVGLLKEWNPIPSYEEGIFILERIIENGEFFEEINSAPIIGIQELWHSEDHTVLLEKLYNQGYISIYEIAKERGLKLKRKNIGLDIWIQKSWLENQRVSLENIEVGFHMYVNENGNPILHILEVLGGYKRGALYARWKNSKYSFLVTNTHLTPLLAWNKTRVKQSKVLAKWAKEQKEDMILLLGDFNFSAEFKNSNNRKLKPSIEKWWKKSSGYLAFTSILSAFDSAYLYNLNPPSTLDNFKNALSFEYNNVKTPELRLDYIWLRPQNKVHVKIKKSEVSFTKPWVNSKEKPRFLSDHFGVNTTFNIYP